MRVWLTSFHTAQCAALIGALPLTRCAASIALAIPALQVSGPSSCFFASIRRIRQLPGKQDNELLHPGSRYAIKTQSYQCLLLTFGLYTNGNDDDANAVSQAA